MLFCAADKACFKIKTTGPTPINPERRLGKRLPHKLFDIQFEEI